MASIQYRFFSRFISLLPLKVRLKVLFFRRFHYLLDFSNVRTFNEKIQFYKVKCRKPELTIAADKIKSKVFVSKIAPELYIPKTIATFRTSNELVNYDFDLLPADYVIKANHTSQTIIIVRDGNHIAKEQLEAKTKSWLKKDQSLVLGEWAYKNIERRLLIEEYLDFEGREPDDYKLFVYDGKVKFIQVDYDRFSVHTRNMYTRDWDLLDFEYSHPNKLPQPDKPEFIEEMITISERIGKNFAFARVDLYFYQGKIAFGEITNYPGAGFEKFPTKEWDLEFGKFLNFG